MNCSKKILTSILAAFLAFSFMGCWGHGFDDDDYGFTKSSDCELKSFCLYYVTTENYSTKTVCAKGVISNDKIFITLPKSKKSADFYLGGEKSYYSKFTWDGIEKSLNGYDVSSSYGIYKTASYTVSFAYEDAHKVVITAEDGKNTKEFTLRVTWATE